MGMQGRPGDQSRIFSAVEKIPGKRAANGRHMNADLMLSLIHISVRPLMWNWNSCTAENSILSGAIRSMSGPRCGARVWCLNALTLRLSFPTAGRR